MAKIMELWSKLILLIYTDFTVIGIDNIIMFWQADILDS